MTNLLGSYLQDMEMIDHVSADIGKYKKGLDKICSLEPNRAGAERLASAYGELRDALELTERYSSHNKPKNDRLPGIAADRIRDIVAVGEEFYRISEGYTDSLFKNWGLASDVLENLDTKSGIEETVEVRQELESIAESYGLVSGFIKCNVSEKNKPVISEIDEYRRFLKDKSAYDERLGQLENLLENKESYNVRQGKLMLAGAELGELEKRYSLLAKEHCSLRQRLSGKIGLFGCAEERERVRRLYGLLKERDAATKKGNLADEEKLLDSWIRIYKSSLGRLSGENKITPGYVEEICNIELADKDMIFGAREEPILAKKLGGFAELDSAVRSQLERELLRVERELDRREMIFESELSEPDYAAGAGQDWQKGNKENLELLLAGAYELSKMRKSCGLGTEKTEAVISELKDRLKRGSVEDRLLRKENSGQYPEQLKGPPIMDSQKGDLYNDFGHKEKESQRRGDENYRSIIREAKSRLAEIAGENSDEGIISRGGIIKLFSARDSFYDKLGKDVMDVINGPSKEIEAMIEDIYNHDRGEIERFIERNSHGRIGEAKIRQAAHYRQIIDEWERRLYA